MYAGPEAAEEEEKDSKKDKKDKKDKDKGKDKDNGDDKDAEEGNLLIMGLGLGALIGLVGGFFVGLRLGGTPSATHR